MAWSHSTPAYTLQGWRCGVGTQPNFLLIGELETQSYLALPNSLQSTDHKSERGLLGVDAAFALSCTHVTGNDNTASF